MPCVSEFYGILIYFYWDDHLPPHFHAKYGNSEMLVCINTLQVIEGSLPPRAKRMVREWATKHKTALLEDWKLCEHKQQPKRIAPLP